MKIIRKFEEVCIHKVRETMLKRYRKSYFLITGIWLTLWIGVYRGKMKDFNRFYESTYVHPFNLISFLLR